MNKHTRQPKCGRHRESGAATLLLTVVLLFVLSILAAYTSKSSLLDLTTINNQQRLQQAQAAADAGLDFALAYYVQGGADQDNDGAADALLIPANLSGGNQASVEFCDPTSITSCNTPTSLTRLRIIATGYSDDGTSVYRASVLVSEASALGLNPKAALTAKGTTTSTLNGNLTVINNNPGGITIWTGTDIGAMTGSFSTKISIGAATDQLSSGKDGSKFFVGPDVVYNDHALAKLQDDAFFREMTGRTKADLIAVADIKISGNETLPVADASNDFLGGKIIYVDKPSFDPNTDLGILGSPPSSDSKPVILIVEGDFELNGPNTINGLVIANSLNKANGSARVNGAIMVKDVNNANGGFTIDMKSTVIDSLSNVVVRAPVNNSWRDWVPE